REPPGVETLTVLGAVLLVTSVLGFIRALQRTYLAAWGVPSSGLRGMGHGVIGAAALIGGFAALALLWPALAALGGHVVIQLVGRARCSARREPDRGGRPAGRRAERRRAERRRADDHRRLTSRSGVTPEGASGSCARSRRRPPRSRRRAA